MGTPINSGLGSATNTESYNYDYSRAFGGSADYSSGGFGSKVFAGDASGATINVVDPGAIAAGRDVALAGITSNEKVLQRVAGSAEAAVSKVLDLVGMKQEGDLGTLVRGALWLVAIIVVGAVAWNYFRSKPAPKEKP